jgi:hypothetical protein
MGTQTMTQSPFLCTRWLVVQASFLCVIGGHVGAADGTLAWSQLWGSPSDDYAYAACADAADHVYVAGYAKGGFDGQTNAGAEDLCLTRFTRDGARVWSRIWGSSAGDFGYGVVADTGAYVYVAGYTAGAFDGQTNTGGKDLCLTKFSAAGGRQWTRIWGSPLDESGWAASADGAGNIYVAGETFGGFDGQTNAGFTDLCLTKFGGAAREIAITSVPFTVFLPDTTAAIAGTNADSIVIGSDMWWLNTSTNGVAGTFVAPVTRAWSVSSIPLAFGPNLVTVGGTNVLGAAVTDTIAIELALPEPGVLLALLGVVLCTMYKLQVTM